MTPATASRLSAVITRIREAVGEEPTFLSFDITALNIAYVHGTQAPAPGELSAVPREFLSDRGLASRIRRLL
ncbi:arginase family protein [Mesorhizobium sp. LjNodule214]|uniref:arginase family protein n=1 Tax=Mesorhizobium sp. LjNodule214 TaxID=3342252 RepID=UPI003F4F3FF1